MEMLEKNDLKVDHCIGIGAGLPGTVDRKKGRVIYSNNIGWENVPFVKELQKYVPLPIYINNNANCIALGEMVKGAARKYVNTVLLTVGNGIGGSIILDGKSLKEGCRAGVNWGICRSRWMVLCVHAADADAWKRMHRYRLC